MLVNRRCNSLVTENVDSMCRTKTAGRSGESIRPGGLKEDWGVDDPGQTKHGEICVLVLGG